MVAKNVIVNTNKKKPYIKANALTLICQQLSRKQSRGGKIRECPYPKVASLSHNPKHLKLCHPHEDRRRQDGRHEKMRRDLGDIKGEKGKRESGAILAHKEKGDKGDSIQGPRGEKGEKGDAGNDGRDAIIDEDLIVKLVIARFEAERRQRRDGRESGRKNAP